MIDCPQCGKRVSTQGLPGHIRFKHGSKSSGDEGKEEAKKTDASSKDEYSTSIRRSIPFSAKQLALAEILVNANLAKDLGDLTHKGHSALAQIYGLMQGVGGKNPMEDTVPNPEDELKKIQAKRALDAELRRMEMESDPLKKLMMESKAIDMMLGKKSDSPEIKMLMDTVNDLKQELREAKRKDAESAVITGLREELRSIKDDIKDMSKNKGGDSRVDALREELKSVKEDKKWDAIMSLVKDKSSNVDATQIIEKLERIRQEGDQKAEAYAAQVQELKEKQILDTLKEMKVKMEQPTNTGIERKIIDKVGEAIVNNMDQLAGLPKKDKMDKVKEIIGTVGQQLRPALDQLGRATAEKIRDRRTMPISQPRIVMPPPPAPAQPLSQQPPRLNIDRPTGAPPSTRPVNISKEQ